MGRDQRKTPMPAKGIPRGGNPPKIPSLSFDFEFIVFAAPHGWNGNTLGE
jgi:hypothetical protein